ncbi:MAG TPA: PAS-domain containing protein, partial [Azospirillaceae bacterium]|nr:PAS-domain containing protein [Azospirillaceae bacterium]
RSATRGHFAECDPRNAEAWIAERLSVHRRAAGPIEQRLTDGRWLRVDERRTADGGNVGLRTDITELKQRQSDLAAKTAVLEATLAAMVQGVLVWDADRRLTTFNQKVQSLLELPPGVLRPGLSIEAFLAYLSERGEFRPSGVDFSASRRQAELFDSRGYCCERRRPNGRTVEVRSTPVAGGLTLMTYIDVTESRAAEAQLRESEERFRKLSDSAMEGILAHENGVIVDANRAAGELLMLPAEEMIGRHLNDFIAPELHDAIIARVSRREESRIELRCLRADGQSIVIEAQNRYVQHRGRAVSMVSFRDVTEQRQAEEKLRAAKEAAERASRLKNDFVRTISHELRTPMNGVLGMLDLLQDAELAAPLRAYAATAYASAEAMLGLLNDLLDLSKIEAGRLSLETSSFDAAESATTAAEVSAARAAAKGLSLAVCVPAGLDCRMASDPARLRQVLLNLVGNAVKFTERGGVALSIDADELPMGDDGAPAPALRFEVRDSGIGIAPDAQRKLFAEFMQVHDVGVRGPGGTGLGLAISKRLVELMGGRIGVESAPGKGSRFWFVLPAGRSAADPAPRGAVPTALSMRKEPALTKELAGCRTVVIDPAAVTRQAVARQLASFGADAVPCADMEEAFIALGDQAGRLSALLAGVGVPAAGAPPKG